MNVKITMLTADIMDDFSKYIESWEENPVLAEKFEYLAYVACMSNYGKENRINRFAELIMNEIGIDFFELKSAYEKAENELKAFIDGKRSYFRYEEIDILSIVIKKDCIFCKFQACKKIDGQYFTMFYSDNECTFSRHHA